MTCVDHSGLRTWCNPVPVGCGMNPSSERALTATATMASSQAASASVGPPKLEQPTAAGLGASSNQTDQQPATKMSKQFRADALPIRSHSGNRVSGGARVGWPGPKTQHGRQGRCCGAPCPRTSICSRANRKPAGFEHSLCVLREDNCQRAPLRPFAWTCVLRTWRKSVPLAPGQ